jgi:alkylation response protein AidB-like acyl-CoA dehydrogenase
MPPTTSDGVGEQIFAEADRLARTFAGRAAEHEREASFPHDNYAVLAAAGMLRMSVPTELGGLDAGLHALGVQEAMARCVTVKHAAAGNAVTILRRLADLNGGAAFGRALSFERMWRDVQAGPVMPVSNIAARQFIGDHALGIAVAPVST